MFRQAHKVGPTSLEARSGTTSTNQEDPRHEALCRQAKRPSCEIQPQSQAIHINPAGTPGEGVPTSFPRCVLHNTNLVNRFPEGCPLRAVNPLDELARFQDEAWRHVGSERYEFLEQGLKGLDVVRICGDCVSRLMRDSWVKHLRAVQAPAEVQIQPTGERGKRALPRNGDAHQQAPRPRIEIPPSVRRSQKARR